MRSSFGRMPTNNFRTHGFILCVDGDRKCTLRTAIVTMTESVTRIMVNIRYLPRSGMESDDEGMISIRTKKKKMSESRMEMERDTCGEVPFISYGYWTQQWLAKGAGLG